jgi:acyl carrier protein
MSQTGYPVVHARERLFRYQRSQKIRAEKSCADYCDPGTQVKMLVIYPPWRRINMNVLDELTKVFREYFEDDEIVLTPETTSADIDGWDSLSHALLMASVENKLKIEFTQRELLSFDNVGDLVRTIEKKL